MPPPGRRRERLDQDSTWILRLFPIDRCTQNQRHSMVSYLIWTSLFPLHLRVSHRVSLAFAHNAVTRENVRTLDAQRPQTTRITPDGQALVHVRFRAIDSLGEHAVGSSFSQQSNHKTTRGGYQRYCKCIADRTAVESQKVHHTQSLYG